METKKESPMEIFVKLLQTATDTSEIIRKKTEVISKKQTELNAIINQYNAQENVVLFSQAMPDIVAQDYHRFHPRRNYTIISVNIVARPICLGEPATCGLMIFLSFTLKEGDGWSCTLNNLTIRYLQGANKYAVLSRSSSGISSSGTGSFIAPGDELAIYDFEQFKLIERAIILAYTQLGLPPDEIKIEK